MRAESFSTRITYLWCCSREEIPYSGEYSIFLKNKSFSLENSEEGIYCALLSYCRNSMWIIYRTPALEVRSERISSKWHYVYNAWPETFSDYRITSVLGGLNWRKYSNLLWRYYCRQLLLLNGGKNLPKNRIDSVVAVVNGVGVVVGRCSSEKKRFNHSHQTKP